MSSQVDPIQTLIAQIDRVLHGTDVSSAQTDEALVQRQVLEDVRQYLAAQPAAAPLPSETTSVEIAPAETTPIEPTPTELASIAPQSLPQSPPPLPAYASVEQSLQQFAQTLAAMHANLLGPLQVEIQTLQRQRQDLIAEVRHLEYLREQQITQRYQQINPQAIAADFWASLQAELHSRIGQSISQSINQHMAQIAQPRAIPPATQPAQLLGDATHPVLLEPVQRLEYLQHVQADADRLLVDLDSTIKLTFGTLQRNIQGYQESLNQQLDRMHHLEHQGEMLLATLVRHVAAAIESPTGAAQLPAQAGSIPHPVDAQIPPTSTTMSIQPGSQSTPPDRSAADELDSALDLLNLEPSPAPPSPEETAAQIDRALSEAIEQSAAAPPSSHPGSAEALETLYASLLSESAQTPRSPDIAPPEPPQLEPLPESLPEQLKQESPQEPSAIAAIEPLPNPVRDDGLDSELEDELEDIVPDRIQDEPELAIADEPLTPEISHLPDETALQPSHELEAISGEAIETPVETPLEPPVEPPVESAPPVETIAALTDLLPALEFPEEPTPEEIQTWEVLQINPDAPLEESEAYLQASPDEVLLPDDEPLLEQEQNLHIDAVTMRKLEADLHSLEGLEAVEADESEPPDADLDAIFPGYLLQGSEPPTPDETPIEPPEPQERWYLGLDIGATGISAALLNWETGTLYPIYWLRSDSSHRSEQAFRLPGAVWIDPAPESELEQAEPIKAVGFEALALADENPQTREFLVSNFTPCLNVGVPWCDTNDRDRWQPIVQWSSDRKISLQTLRHALSKLLQAIALGTFTDAQTSETEPPTAHLNPSSALPKLSGAIVNAGSSYSPAYRFNLREAVLQAGLVSHPEQVAFVEDSIATVLSALPGDPFASPSEPGWQFTPDRRGTTLAIDAGASRTELVLVDLPIDPTTLTYNHFHHHSFEYGGHAIDRDIICQLFLKASVLPADLGNPPATLPRPGESDAAASIALQQWLESSPSGLSALELAQQVKVVLQEQEQFAFTWGERSMCVKRQDWESQVLLPYVQRLNRELNLLVSRTGVAVEGIERALCTGGNAAWEAIARWLRQKLPNATILQDVYPSHSLPACSRVACGLATLPLYPQILEDSSQQYHDYFLLHELLQLPFDRPMALADIISHLEMRGIHALSCQPQIAAIVRGQLPVGLLPTQPTSNWLTAAARTQPIYQQLAQKPLFPEVGDRAYLLDTEQAQLVHQYLQRVIQDSKQTFAEPLPLTFSVSTGLNRRAIAPK